MPTHLEIYKSTRPTARTAARKKTVTTYHPLDVAKSLEAQNDAIGLLLHAVYMFVSLNEAVPGIDILRDAAEECRTVMWPDEER